MTVLAVDLDEVVFAYTEGLRREMLAKGLTPPEGCPTSYSMSDSGWFKTVEEFKKFHGEAVEEGLYERLDTLPQARETLWDLSEAGYTLNIITSRFVNPGQHKKVVSQTVAALDKAHIPYSNISFLADKTLQYADAYIDDSPHNLEGLSKCGRFVLCMDMLYNREAPGVRVHSWPEIREVLRDKFGK